MKLSTKKISLDHLFLDPNNYRFIDQPDYVFVEDKDITSASVQRKTLRFLAGSSMDGIKDLIDSIKTNGFLEFEQVQVRPIGSDNYAVVEGNRRIATLKTLKKLFEAGGEFPELMPDSYNRVTVSIIDGYNEKDNYIAMGLQHIGGKKKWSPLNQARLLRDLLTKQHMGENEICNSLGISRNTVRIRMRALSLADIYMASDFGDQFKSEMFSFFEEIVKRPELRIWLGWDDVTSTCTNQLNQERIFNWISFIEADEDHLRQEPIIMKSAEIRELAGFINDEKAIQMMELTRSFSEGKLNITTGTSQIKQSIDKIYKEARVLSENEDAITDEDYRTLKNTLDRVKKILSLENISINNISSYRLSASLSKSFTTIKINKFRGLSNVQLCGLSRVNLFVGDNNSGKTSMLEAIYMLTQMNNLNKYLSIERFRGKVDGNMSPSWMSEYLDDYYDIEGIFGDDEYKVHCEQKKDDSQNIDRQGYLTTIYTNATRNNSEDSYNMKIHIYERKDFVVNSDKVVCICPSTISSAYRRDRNALLEAYTVVIENNLKQVMLEFIKQHFDEDIIDINLVGEKENYRFMVTSKRFSKAMDITKYGEGLQRVLEISLYVISCANGCAFIDEIDSAVHKSLLDEFLKYITELSKNYNVQLFVSTHNKECVESFVNIQDDVTAFKLKRNVNGTNVLTSDAKSLSLLIQQGKIDIR